MVDLATYPHKMFGTCILDVGASDDAVDFNMSSGYYTFKNRKQVTPIKHKRIVNMSEAIVAKLSAIENEIKNINKNIGNMEKNISDRLSKLETLPSDIAETRGHFKGFIIGIGAAFSIIIGLLIYVITK